MKRKFYYIYIKQQGDFIMSKLGKFEAYMLKTAAKTGSKCSSTSQQNVEED